ncbi:hypothetical protein [Variovorax sp. WDL1]|nr:hypothetical protein [Variovorax sp. WDL1]
MVNFYLDDVSGLTLQDKYTKFVAASRLGEEATKPLANAIGHLMQKGLVQAARKLMDMCKASALPSLLSLCSPDHVEKLTGNTGKVGEGSEDAMRVKVLTAMRSGNLSGAYRLLSLCSADTSANLSTLLPPLDEKMVRALDIDALVDALHVTLVRIRPADEAARQNELTSLLSIADRVDPARMVAMQCVIGLSDGPQELRDLALLPQLSLELLQALPKSLQADVLHLAVQQAMNSPEQRESLLELALTSGNLTTAASLMHDSPDPEFPQKLFGAVLKRLELAGFKVGQKPFTFDIKDLGPANSETEAAKKEQRTLTAQKMAIVLLMTGEPYHAEAARRIISTINAEPVQQQAFIGELIDRLGFGRGTLSETMANALPTLCSDDHALILDIVLATEEGEKLVAQAAVKCLLGDDCSGDTAASLFDKLAHRVPILHVLPNIQSTLNWDVDGSFIGVAAGPMLTDMIAVAKNLKIDRLVTFEPAPGWVSGWRSLGSIVLDHRQNRPDDLIHDSYRLLAARLIDAAATQSDDVLKLMELMDFKPQERLADMIANGLLSGDALRNVMLAMMSNPELLSRTLAAIDGLGTADLQRLAFTEIVRALIALPKERSDDAGAKSAAQAVYKSAVFDQVRKEIHAIDNEAWPQFLSRFPST